MQLRVGHIISFGGTSTSLTSRKLRGHKALTYALGFSSDGATLARGGNDNSLALWDVVTGELKRVLMPEWARNSYVLSVAFSPDGKTVATGTYLDDKVRIWDVESGAVLLTIPENSVKQNIVFT